jgi:Glyoxalase-like domain
MGDPQDGGNDPAAPIGWIREIVLDTAHPLELASFWAGLLGGEPTQWYDGWVTLEPPPHGQRLSFQRSDRVVEDATVHFDVLVDDLEAADRRVRAAGAEYVDERRSPRPDADGEAVRWRVYRDPAGHQFCLVLR